MAGGCARTRPDLEDAFPTGWPDAQVANVDNPNKSLLELLSDGGASAKL